MKPIAVSKPLQALLCAAVALSVVALLKSEPLALRDDVVKEPGAPARAVRVSVDGMSEGSPPWERPERDAWKPDDASPGTATSATAVGTTVKTAVPRVDATLPDAATPLPAAPDPGLVYLGRIEQDRRHYVFVGRGAVPQVVEIGSAVDAQWKVERATATQVELRHLPFSDLRSIAIR